MRIYKEQVNIEGYGIFDKICSFDRKGGTFAIQYPTRIVSKERIKKNELSTSKFGAVVIDFVFSRTLKEAEQEWDEQVLLFESVDHKYNRVIKYTSRQDADAWDGSGVGLFINWGVFREVEIRGELQYFFEYGALKSKLPVLDSYSEDRKHWKKMDWSQEREDFFNKISTAISDIETKLNYFIENCDEVIANNQQLLIG